MSEIQKILLEDGIKYGMCEKFRRILSGKDLLVDELLSLFHRGQDFCIKNNWPSLSLARKLFSSDDLERNGIFIDKTGSVCHTGCIVVMGDSDVTLHIDDWSVTSVEVRHNSKVKLIVGKNSSCYVSTHDDCEVSVVEKQCNSRLCASVFSGTLNNQDKFDKINNKN